MDLHSVSTVKRLDLSSLNTEQIKAFQALTKPEFYPCLYSKNPHGIPHTKIVAIASIIDGKPAGLILATIYSKLHIAEVDSFFVSEAFRDHHIGTELLRELDKELEKEGCYLVTYVYPAEDPLTPTLEHVLQNTGWATSSLFTIKCLFDCRLFNPPWFQKEYLLPVGFEIFQWQDLTAQERKVLMRREDQGSIHQSVSPFIEEERIEYVNSIGLRYKNDVVGWMITHRMSPDLMRYTSLYIERSLQLQGPAIYLLAESIKRQQRSPIQWSILEVNVNQTELSWLSFLKRKLIPHAQSVTRTLQAWKKLGTE